MRAELSEFLKSRRARLRPQDVGLPDYGNQRRVQGLRREELAQLAGVSVTHYTRLEQGHRHHISMEVVDAIATALRLTAAERRHLHHLVRPPRPGGVEELPEIRPGLRCLLDSLVLTPAAVIGRRNELLAWNPLLNEVAGDLNALAPGERTIAHWLFLGDSTRQRLREGWAVHARLEVAFLRSALARYPEDERLRGHVAVLRVRSAEFDRMWQDHEVDEWTSGEDLVLYHPTAGRLEFAYERAVLPDDPEISGLIMWSTRTGSPSHAALRRLASEVDLARP